MFVKLLLQRKSQNITYSECAFVAFGIQLAMSMRHSHLCPIQLQLLFHVISLIARFYKTNIEYETCFGFVRNIA
jgi:mannose/fructose/N-acetylgalactosamine-specific phosphotransferase system component IID